MDGDDCIGTFEVKRGSSASAQFVAFVMDTSGAILARDSASVKSAVVAGLLVDFRFRHVACDSDRRLAAAGHHAETARRVAPSP